MSGRIAPAGGDGMSRMLGSYNSEVTTQKTSTLHSGTKGSTRGTGHLQIKVGVSATQLIARDLQPIKIAERSYGDGFGLKEFLS